MRIIGAKQGGDTKTLIDEALTVAANASAEGRTQSAKTAMDIANRLLAEQKAARSPAPPEFFASTIQKYKQVKQYTPELADSVWKGATTLAEYRSEITPVPEGAQVHIGQLSNKGPFRYLRDSFISGQNAIAFGGEHGFVLDGFILENVTFQNVPIIYHGGPAILTNVRFVNCHFDFSQSPKSEQLLEAMVNQPANVTID